PELAPAPACHRRAVCWRPSRNGAALRSGVPTTGWFPPPSPPASSALTQWPVGRKSLPGDTTADDRHTLRSERGPIVPARLGRARWVALVPLLARCGHTLYNSAWDAHAEPHRSLPGRTPASR